MTDIKELLTLAAKACGKDLTGWDWGGDRDGYYLVDPSKGVFGQPQYWAPHLDDGDGARMEAKLCLDVAWGADNVVVSTPIGRGHIEYYANHNGDEQAARRWASFRAAAQVGRSMP